MRHRVSTSNTRHHSASFCQYGDSGFKRYFYHIFHKLFYYRVLFLDGLIPDSSLSALNYIAVYVINIKKDIKMLALIMLLPLFVDWSGYMYYTIYVFCTTFYYFFYIWRKYSYSNMGMCLSDNLLGISWVDSGWVPILNPSNVLEYFSERSNPFYDRTCNNEVVKMQRLTLDHLK